MQMVCKSSKKLKIESYLLVDCPSFDPLTDVRSHGELLITMKLVNIWRELDLSAEYKYVSMSADK